MKYHRNSIQSRASRKLALGVVFACGCLSTAPLQGEIPESSLVEPSREIDLQILAYVSQVFVLEAATADSIVRVLEISSVDAPMNGATIAVVLLTPGQDREPIIWQTGLDLRRVDSVELRGRVLHIRASQDTIDAQGNVVNQDYVLRITLPELSGLGVEDIPFIDIQHGS
ncbi:MAG: hypothetical protein ACFCU3_03125 [Verrucomicrobiales bacterium]